MAEGEEVENKQVILNHCVRGSPKESDMEIRTARTKLKLPGGSSGAILVKILYLSCEPYTYVTNGMSKMEGKIEGVNLESFNPGSGSYVKDTLFKTFVALHHYPGMRLRNKRSCFGCVNIAIMPIIDRALMNAAEKFYLPISCKYCTNNRYDFRTLFHKAEAPRRF